MSQNPHFKQTLDAITVMYEGTGSPTEAMALTAVQAQATLALAYEQRTTNLIALLVDGASGPIPGVDYNALTSQIVARLHPEGK